MAYSGLIFFRCVSFWFGCVRPHLVLHPVLSCFLLLRVPHSLLQLLVDVVDAELLEVVVVKNLEAVYVKDAHRQPLCRTLYGLVHLHQVRHKSTYRISKINRFFLREVSPP